MWMLPESHWRCVYLQSCLWHTVLGWERGIYKYFNVLVETYNMSACCVKKSLYHAPSTTSEGKSIYTCSKMPHQKPKMQWTVQLEKLKTFLDSVPWRDSWCWILPSSNHTCFPSSAHLANQCVKWACLLDCQFWTATEIAGSSHLYSDVRKVALNYHTKADHWEIFWVWCLAQGHLSMWTGGWTGGSGSDHRVEPENLQSGRIILHAK